MALIKKVSKLVYFSERSQFHLKYIETEYANKKEKVE